MSVYTRMDELSDEIRDLIYQAEVKVAEMLNPETWGHQDCSDSYIERLHEIAIELKKIKKDL